MTDTIQVEGGLLRYEATDRAGMYRIAQGSKEQISAVNFLDPLESNLLERASTWRAVAESEVASERQRPVSLPAAASLAALVLLLLLLEWYFYGSKR